MGSQGIIRIAFVLGFLFAAAIFISLFINGFWGSALAFVVGLSFLILSDALRYEQP